MTDRTPSPQGQPVTAEDIEALQNIMECFPTTLAGQMASLERILAALTAAALRGSGQTSEGERTDTALMDGLERLVLADVENGGEPAALTIIHWGMGDNQGWYLGGALDPSPTLRAALTAALSAPPEERALCNCPTRRDYGHESYCPASRRPTAPPPQTTEDRP